MTREITWAHISLEVLFNFSEMRKPRIPLQNTEKYLTYGGCQGLRLQIIDLRSSDMVVVNSRRHFSRPTVVVKDGASGGADGFLSPYWTKVTGLKSAAATGISVSMSNTLLLYRPGATNSQSRWVPEQLWTFLAYYRRKTRKLDCDRELECDLEASAQPQNKNAKVNIICDIKTKMWHW